MKVCSVCQRCYADSVLSCSEANHEPLTEGRAGNCEIIANYRLDLRLESSPMGESYRALNTILKKPYLIKILAPGLFAAEQKSKETFLREAQDLSALVHPNVARVYESGTLRDGSVYAVTEFFTAQTLRDCLVNVGSPSEVTALTITRQAAEGLEAIHAAGVLHKNICPENIILTSDAENRFLVKLQNIDFGGIRQKIVNSSGDQNLNALKYFAPEQCAAQTVDAQTDVYSLGIVLYEALAGQTPFDAADADVLINKQINEPPPPVEIHSFDIRMLLTHTLTDALQKTARLRLKTANAMTRRIRHIEQLATHSPTPPPAMAYPATMNKAAARFSPPPKIENSFAVEKQIVAEDIIPVENHTIIEESVPVEDQSMMESAVFENAVPVEDQPVTENTELPALACLDLTTTKLPPIESILENHLSENLPNAQPEAVVYETAENPEIHVTNDAALIEWEQPDDIPSISKTFKTVKEENFETEFAPEEFFTGDEDFIIDAGDADSPLDPDSQVEEVRPRYAAQRPVFSYDDSGTSWNLPAKRKILTGAGLVVLAALAVGGTLLSRQSQLARDTEQTTAQSGSKTLPKAAEPDKVSETDKSSTAKPETLTVNNPVSTADNPELPELPDYQPRETEEKNVATVAQIRSKKRSVKEISENGGKTAQNKPVSNEIFDKKGEVKSSPDKKSALKSQSSTSAKPEIFTRPRIVKNPKF